MAEPEDPHPDAPTPFDDFDDDLVGFASPRALSASPARPIDPPAGATPELARSGEPEPEPEPAPEPQVDPMSEALPEPMTASRPSEEAPVAPPPQAAPGPAGREDDLFEAPEPTPDPPAEVVQPPVTMAPVAMAKAEREPAMDTADRGDPGPEPDVAPPPDAERSADIAIAPLSPVPEQAPVPTADTTGEAFGQPGATRPFDRPAGRRAPGVTAEGDARLSLTIYACLIASAVSVGLTAVIALFLAWTGRLLVQGWTRSHLLYQLRTSLIGVIAGVVGVLTLPLGLGVFILSLTVIWVVARGTAGLLVLLRREEIRDPKTWKLP